MLRRQIFTDDPNFEINVQHVFVERGSIAADANQQPSLGRLGDDGVQRSGVAIAVESRRGGAVQASNVCSALEPPRGPISSGGSRPIECATRRFKRLSCGDWK